MTAWEWLIDINKSCHFMSRERTGRASNSELKRWIQNKALIINGEPMEWNEEIDFTIVSVVLFPKNPVTLF